MAETTGIAWTNGTVNFWIGCTHVGPGCGEGTPPKGCYAEIFANRKFNIIFGPGQRRMRTLAGYENPLRWQRKHEAAAVKGEPALMKAQGQMVPVPIWVFANSLSDFFDNEIDLQWRTDAWAVIKATPMLRWQLVTKRVGNVRKMLPADWNNGAEYQHVGIIATMVNQDEYDRDAPKLEDLYRAGIKWTGISMEPQLGPIKMNIPTDWVITGGESKQGDHQARPYDARWALDLIHQCSAAGIPIFVKQMGDAPRLDGKPLHRLKAGGTDATLWVPELRVQQMPRIYPELTLHKPDISGAQGALL